jgi:lysophospholipase L1-like esterase
MQIKRAIAAGLLALSGALYSQTGDLANLARYRDANNSLPPGKARVVFLGDSITDYWGKRGGQWFPSPDWLNRGIGGQTTGQLLLRTRQDVIALHPRALIIEGGSNDMRLGFSPETIRDNIASIADIARANHIRVLIAAMTPVCDCVRPLTGERTVARIRHLNDLLNALCKQHHYAYLDYYAPLADGAGRMRQELTTDGVHLNDQGYSRIAPIVVQSLKHGASPSS